MGIRKFSTRFAHLLFISLIFTIFLLTSDLYPCLAGEFNLSSALSVKIPEAQTANPGDFVTYVLQLVNHSGTPLNLEVKYITPPHWNVLGDNAFILQQQNPYFFPITIQVPAEALADSEASIQIQFKLKGGPDLPVFTVPVKVNPVSMIDFIVPQSIKTPYGTAAAYTITIANHGNTGEQFSVGCSSENGWHFEIEPKIFRLDPGQFQEVRVTHQVPPYTDLGSDQLTLTFSWNSEQKAITLATQVENLPGDLGQKFYIWQGQVNLYHPNLMDLKTYPSSSVFSLQGQLGPDSSAQIYASDILDPNKPWYIDLKSASWETEAGLFPLTWPGLIEPVSSSGKLLLSDRKNDGIYSIYTWSTDQPGASVPVGFEISLPDRSSYRILRQTLPDDSLTVAEWESRSEFHPGLEWSHTLAYNLSNPSNYGYSLGLQGEAGERYWSSGFQSIHNYLTYPFQNRLSLSWGQTGSAKGLNANLQLKYDFGANTQFYQDYSLAANLRWLQNLYIILADKYHLLEGAPTSNNATIYLESGWNTEQYEHNWWLNYSLDHETEGTTSYTKLYWLTDYSYNDHEDLLFNPQLIATSFPSINDGSKLGLGYHREWLYGPDLTVFGYAHLNPEISWSSDIELDWKIYQYSLTFRYTGSWREGRLVTDVCSLILNQDFILPLKRPLGTIEGLVYLDLNHNGIHDPGEPPAGNVSFYLDGESVRFNTDSDGHFQIGGLDPGEHRITLDTKYEAVYQPINEKTTTTVKAYQNAKVEIPLTRTQNLIGSIYKDLNQNGTPEMTESGLTGITVILSDNNGNEIDRTVSGENGSFIFYQLEPEIYQVKIEPGALPEDLQLPVGQLPLTVDMSGPDVTPILAIGLRPYEKPVELVSEIQPLTIFVNPEMGYIGDTINVTVECQLPLTSLELQFPDATMTRLKISNPDTRKSYSWKITGQTPKGQVKIFCRAQGLNGATYQTEANLIVLSKE